MIPIPCKPALPVLVTLLLLSVGCDNKPAETGGQTPDPPARAAVEPRASRGPGGTNAPPSGSPTQAAPKVKAGPVSPPAEPEKPTEVQVSFKGANIDMVVQWLAESTGKSVVKHPTVQCKVTIVSSNKLPVQDAVNLIYQALSLEGFTTIETSDAIMIVPTGKEPKVSPELVQGADAKLPAGRQRVVKVFDLVHLTATEMEARTKGILSEKATMEVDPRGNRLIVTDYTENVRLLGELLPVLDVETGSDNSIQVYPLKHLEAQETSELLNQMMSADPPAPGSGSGSRSGSNSSPRNSRSGSGKEPSTGPSGETRIWPDPYANRLIVSAPKANQPEILRLIGMLDVEKPQDVAIRVLPLRHADASALVQEVAPLYRKLSGNSLKDVIEITANQRSNSLIILSSETNYKRFEAFIGSIDTEDALDQVMKTVELQNADAEDVAEQIKDLGNSQPATSRYVYYYGSPSRGGDSKKMQVVADRRRNTLILLASPGEMESILKVVEELDKPIDGDALAPRIYQLKYVGALDIEEVLKELFLKKEEQRGYFDYYYGSFNQGGDSGQDVGRLFGKVRITSEPYSNAIIVTANSKESLEAVEAILKQLDVPSEAGDSTLRVELKFADAIEVANSLNILFAKGGSPALRPVSNQPQNNRQNNPNQEDTPSQTGFQLENDREKEPYFPWLGGQQDNGRSRDGTTVVRPASDLVGRVRVVPDRRSNSLLLTADVQYFPQVLSLVRELDAPTAQVLIEARILEVSSDFRDKLGIRWSADGSQSFDADDLDGALAPSVTGNALKNFTPAWLTSGVLDANVNLDVLVQFMRKNTDAVVLGDPKINVSDNEVGKLFVGAQVPFINSSQNTPQGGRNDAFQYKDVGIILEVTPQINNSEEVAIKVRAESSNIRNGQTLFGGAILDTRNFRTDLLIKNGETVILGGIIQEEEGEIVRKVPVLGSIPLLGWAFKKKDKTTRQVELMVFLRVIISRTPEEAVALVNEVEKDMPRLKLWRDLRRGPPAPNPVNPPPPIP